MKTLFLDMDGVLADFDGALSPESRLIWNPPEMFRLGFFRDLAVMPGALEAVPLLMEHFDVYVGSKMTSKAPNCATEKVEWIAEHFPALKGRMVLCCCKSLLRGDYLIDDDEDRWRGKFNGEFIHFDHEHPNLSWADILAHLGV